jgi:hypothetical protein
MAWSNGYGRNLEDQADRVGLRYAYEAGFDITKGPRLWNRFAKKYGEPGKTANFFFGDHSLSSQRAVALERELALNYPDGPKRASRARRGRRGSPPAPRRAPARPSTGSPHGRRWLRVPRLTFPRRRHPRRARHPHGTGRSSGPA